MKEKKRPQFRRMDDAVKLDNCPWHRQSPRGVSFVKPAEIQSVASSFLPSPVPLSDLHVFLGLSPGLHWADVKIKQLSLPPPQPPFPQVLVAFMAAGDIEEFIQQNRQLAERIDAYRSLSETEKHWKCRREFILRNLSDYQDPHLDSLLALSMVWANNVFLGCRYSQELLDKVREMADGIVVEDAPVFKTRDEIIKQQQRR